MKAQAAPSNIVFWIIAMGIGLVILLAVVFLFYGGLQAKTSALPGL